MHQQPSPRTATAASRRSVAHRRGGTRVRIAAVVVILVVLVAVGGTITARSSEHLTPPEPLGAPIRLATADGDAVLMLTSQWRTVELRGARVTSPRRQHTELLVHLWRFDPATARPVWRRTLLEAEDGDRSGAALLGADGETVWLYARGLHAARATDGEVVLDPARLLAAAPQLGDLLPTEPHGYVLDSAGLTVTTADARSWLVSATPVAVRPAPPAPVNLDPLQISLPRILSGWVPYRTEDQLARGLTAPPGWLGLLDDAEAAALRSAEAEAAKPATGGAAMMNADGFVPPLLQPSAARRYRLWAARITPVQRPAGDLPEWMGVPAGTRNALAELAPLPRSPEFLQGALLTTGPRMPPIALRDPDGLLVLHRDRLDDRGRLRLTRVSTTDGRPLWEADLPLGQLQSVLPGARTLVLYGLGPSPTDDQRDAHPMLVMVELESGTVRGFDLLSDG